MLRSALLLWAVLTFWLQDLVLCVPQQFERIISESTQRVAKSFTNGGDAISCRPADQTGTLYLYKPEDQSILNIKSGVVTTNLKLSETGSVLKVLCSGQILSFIYEDVSFSPTKKLYFAEFESPTQALTKQNYTFLRDTSSWQLAHVLRHQGQKGVLLLYNSITPNSAALFEYNSMEGGFLDSRESALIEVAGVSLNHLTFWPQASSWASIDQSGGLLLLKLLNSSSGPSLSQISYQLGLDGVKGMEATTTGLLVSQSTRLALYGFQESIGPTLIYSKNFSGQEIHQMSIFKASQTLQFVVLLLGDTSQISVWAIDELEGEPINTFTRGDELGLFISKELNLGAHLLNGSPAELQILFIAESTSTGLLVPSVSSFERRAVGCLDYISSRSCYYNCESPTYFLHQPSGPGMAGSCLQLQEIPAGYGVSDVPAQTRPCKTGDCKDCREDFSVCIECFPTFYLLSLGNQTCVTEPAKGLGINLGAEKPRLDLCIVDGCYDCSADHLSCQVCRPSYALDSTTLQTCYKLTEIPPKLGLVLPFVDDFKTLAPCASSNCLNCSFDFRDCRKCEVAADPSTQTYLFGSYCWKEAELSQLPPGIGKNSDKLTLEACATVGCSDCLDDYLICKSCLQTGDGTFEQTLYLGYIPVESLSQQVCLPGILIPSGQGVDVSSPSPSFSACEDSACISCTANTKLCNLCQEHTYLFNSTQEQKEVCTTIQQLKEMIPIPALGVDPTLMRFIPCNDPQCLVCHDNNKQCLICQAGYQLLKSKSGSEISCSQNIHDGIGYLNTTHLAHCTDPSCKDCRANFSECQECLDTVFHHRSDTTTFLKCYPYQVPLWVLEGLGLNPISQSPLLPQCSSVSNPSEQFGFQSIEPAPNCLDCTSDYLSCKTCNQNFYLVKNPWIETSWVCVSWNEIPEGLGRNLSDSRAKETSPLVPCKSDRCSDCRDDHTDCSICQFSFFLYSPTRTTKPCYNMTEIMSEPSLIGFGVDSATRYLKECQDSANCLTCYSDYLSCEECKLPSFALFRPMGSQISQCVSISGFGDPKFGLDAANRTFNSCSDPRCLNCTEDYQICKVCEEPYFLVTLQNGTNFCQSWPSPLLSNTTALGLNLMDPYTNQSLRECITAHCDSQGCIADNQRCQNCSVGYLLLEDAVNPQNTQCLASAPPGFGLDVQTQTSSSRAILRPCAATPFGCKLCPSDFQQCEECISGKRLNFSARTQANTGSCLDYPMMYAGFGLDPLNQRQLRPCTAKDCEDCAVNFSRCVKCRTTPIYYLDEVSSPSHPVCRSATDLANLLKLGIDVQSVAVAKLRECQVSNCLKCQPDSLNCTQCQANFGLRVQNNLGSQCVFVSDIEAKAGIDLALQMSGFVGPMKNCTDPKCDDCQANIAICSRCQLGSFIGLSGLCEDCSAHCERCSSSKVCDVCSIEQGIYALRRPSAIDGALEVSCVNISAETPTGFGRNQSSTTRYLYPCDIQDCADCLGDNLVCSKCEDAFWLIRSLANLKVCSPKSPTSPPAGYRFSDSTNSNLEACVVLSCLYCPNSASECEECASNPPLYLSVDKRSCLSPLAIPMGFGIKRSAAVASLQRCQVPYCLECRADSSACEACQSQYFLEVDAQQQFHCILSTDPEEGFGLNPETNLFVPCADDNCQLCATDYRTCQQCYLGAYLLPSDLLPSRNYTARCIRLEDTDWPARYGIPAQVLMTDLKSQTLRPCTDPSCSDCSEDYQSCYACPPGFLILQSTLRVAGDDLNLLIRKDLNRRPARTCFASVSLVSAGIGIANGSGLELEPCRIVGCRSCSSNSSRCDECLQGFYTDPRTNWSCLSLQEALTIPGFGLKTLASNSLLVACGTPNCRNCSSSYTICTDCDPGYLRWQTATTVLCLKPTDALVVNSGRGANSISGAFENCQPQFCRNCAADFTICNLCLGVVYSLTTSPGQVACFGGLDELPDGKGLKKGSKTEIVACTDSNCQSCPQDHSVCNSCLGNELYLVNGSCIAREVIYLSLGQGEGLALDAPPNFKLKCQTPNCRECKEDFRDCELCDVGYLYLDGSCTPATDTSIGYGLDPTLNQLLPCAISGCARCSANRLLCQECTQETLIQIESAAGAIQACLQAANDLTTGYAYGPVSSQLASGQPRRLRPCLDSSNCESCEELYTKCTTCKPGFFRNPDTLSCSMIGPSVPEGTGITLWPSPPKFIPCSSTSCVLCPLLPSSCLKCASNFILHAQSGECLSQAIVEGKGFATQSGGTISTCQVPYCKKCPAGGESCIECFSGYGLLIDNSSATQTVSCLDLAKFPPRTGLSPDKTKVQPCSVPNCKVCTTDTSKCEFCLSGFFPAGSLSTVMNQTESCLSLQTIPAGKGINLSTLTVDDCVDRDCILCTVNNSACLKCREGYTLDFLGNQTCQPIANLNLSTIQPTQFQNTTESQKVPPSGGSHGISEATFSVDVSFFDQDDVVYLPYIPQTGKVIENMTVQSHRFMANNKGLRFQFAFPSSVSGVSVLIKSLQVNQTRSAARLASSHGLKRILASAESEEDSNPFDTGVLLSDVSYYKFEHKDTARTLSLVVVIIMTVMAFLILCIDTPLGFRIAEVVMIVRLFAFWNGDTPKVLTECLYWFRINPFSLIPFWKVDEDILSCTGPSILSITDTDCLLYNNLSRYIPTILAILTLRAFGSWMLSIINSWRATSSGTTLSEQEQEELSSHSTKVIKDLKLIVGQIWFHTIIPITFFSWVNIYSSNTSTGMKVGFICSAIFLIAHLLTILWGFWCIQDFKGKTSLEDWKLTQTSKYLFVYELELTSDRSLHRFANYARPLELLKHYLFATLVAVLVDQPLSLGFSVVFLQALHLGFLLICRPYTADNLRLQFLTAQEVIYTLMSCLLLATYSKLASLERGTRETSLGILLAAVCPMFACITCLLLGTYLPLMRRPPAANAVRPRESKTDSRP